MRAVFVSSFYFLLIGAGLSCPLIAAQVVDSGRQILSAQQFQDYRFFFEMGERLPEFAALGWIAAASTLTLFLLWAARELRVAETRDVVWGLRVTLLFTVYASAVGFALWYSLACGTSSALRHALVADAFFLTPAILLFATGARGPLPVAAAFTLAAGLPDSHFIDVSVYPVPSFLWTHFGPLGIFVSVTVCAAMLGTAVGICLYGLSPDGEGRLGGAAGLTLMIVAIALAVRCCWLTPSYQIGQDLATILDLHPGPIAGCTVVWLDWPRPAVQQPSFNGLSTPANCERVRRWLETSPWPSAQTRPAAAVAGNQALYEWNLDLALLVLDLQRRRQPNDSNLNAAMLEVLDDTAPDGERRKLARAFLDADRFICTGEAARHRVAGLLQHGGLEVPPDFLAGQPAALATPAATGEIRGRLVLNGRPLAFVPVALIANLEQGFHRDSEVETVAPQPSLVNNEAAWRASSRAYMNLRMLREFYAVVTTDASGTFHFESLGRGLYLPAVRLPEMTGVELENGAGVIALEGEGARLDIGTLRLRRY